MCHHFGAVKCLFPRATIKGTLSPLFSTFTRPPFRFSQSFLQRFVSLSLACLHSFSFSQHYFLRVVFLRVSVESIPSAEPFVSPNSPVLDYLHFLLPLIEPAVGRLQLSVTHLLIQGSYPCIPRLLVLSLLYIMGHNDGSDSDGMGDSYLALSRSALTLVDKAWIRGNCFIPLLVNLWFNEAQNGAVLREDVHEVCLYEAMFRARLRLLFPRVVRDVLRHLNLAPHQITPNAWKYFFACISLWPSPSGMSIL